MRYYMYICILLSVCGVQLRNAATPSQRCTYGSLLYACVMLLSRHFRVKSAIHIFLECVRSLFAAKRSRKATISCYTNQYLIVTLYYRHKYIFTHTQSYIACIFVDTLIQDMNASTGFPPLDHLHFIRFKWHAPQCVKKKYMPCKK